MIIDSYIPFKLSALFGGLAHSFSSAFVGTFFPLMPFALAGDFPFHTFGLMTSINTAVQNKIGKYMIALLAMVK